MIADLAIEWWVIAHGRISPATHCHQCAPKRIWQSVDCSSCGEGPLVAMDTPEENASGHALVRLALTTSGWRDTPDGKWVCRSCQ